MEKMGKTHLAGVPFKNKIVLVSHSARNQHTINKKLQIENECTRLFQSTTALHYYSLLWNSHKYQAKF